MAHVFALDDVKDLVRSGIDGFAHMVRDKDVDDELIGLLKQRPDVFFVETLWGERRALYTEKPAWVDDPALRQAFSADDIAQLGDQLSPDPKADPKAVCSCQGARRHQPAQHREALCRRRAARPRHRHRRRHRRPVLRPRLPRRARASGDQGGAHADAGGHARHLYRGPNPAPRRSRHVGPGKSADFIVLDANPLDDIANTRKIARVYLRGEEVPRAALSAKWKGAQPAK